MRLYTPTKITPIISSMTMTRAVTEPLTSTYLALSTLKSRPYLTLSMCKAKLKMAHTASYINGNFVSIPLFVLGGLFRSTYTSYRIYTTYLQKEAILKHSSSTCTIWHMNGSLSMIILNGTIYLRANLGKCSKQMSEYLSTAVATYSPTNLCWLFVNHQKVALITSLRTVTTTVSSAMLIPRSQKLSPPIAIMTSEVYANVFEHYLDMTHYKQSRSPLPDSFGGTVGKLCRPIQKTRTSSVDWPLVRNYIYCVGIVFEVVMYIAIICTLAIS